MTAPEAPNLAKMSEVRETSQQIGAFLDWLLNERGVELMRWQTIVHRDDCVYTKTSMGHEALIDIARMNAEFRGEDPDSIEIPVEWHPEHCRCKGTNVVTWEEEGWLPARSQQSGPTIQAWLADYFGVDLAALEDERRAMLEHLRSANEANT